MSVLPHMSILSHTRMGRPIRVWDIPYAYGTIVCPIRVWASHLSTGYSSCNFVAIWLYARYILTPSAFF